MHFWKWLFTTQRWNLVMVSETGLQEDIINTEIKKVVLAEHFAKPFNKNTGVPFMLNYHPLLKKVNCIISKHLYVLYMNEEIKKVFELGITVLFWSPRNLRSYLVRAKLYPVERKTGSCKCNGKTCQVCFNVSETETISSTVAHILYKINQRIDCNDIYLYDNLYLMIYIYWTVRPVLSSTLVVLQTVLHIVGTNVNVMAKICQTWGLFAL